MVDRMQFDLGYTFWGTDTPIMRFDVNFAKKKVKVKRIRWKRNGRRWYPSWMPFLKKVSFKTFWRFLMTRYPSHKDEPDIWEALEGYFERVKGETYLGYASRIYPNYNPAAGEPWQHTWMNEFNDDDPDPEDGDEYLIYEGACEVLAITEGRRRWIDNTELPDEPDFYFENVAYGQRPYRDVVSEGEDNRNLIKDNMYFRPVYENHPIPEVRNALMGDVRYAMMCGAEIAGTNGYESDGAWFMLPYEEFSAAYIYERYLKEDRTPWGARKSLDLLHRGRLQVVNTLVAQGKLSSEEVERVLDEDIKLLPKKMKLIDYIKAKFSLREDIKDDNSD